jgi:hypothetical protein
MFNKFNKLSNIKIKRLLDFLLLCLYLARCCHKIFFSCYLLVFMYVYFAFSGRLLFIFYFFGVMQYNSPFVCFLYISYYWIFGINFCFLDSDNIQYN